MRAEPVRAAPRRARRAHAPALVLALGALAFASVQCGLLAAPGDYASGDGDEGDASFVDARAMSDEATTHDSNVVLPDGNVVAASIGTLALMAGEREPTSPEDDPAWSADAWSGVLGADGRVVTWNIAPSAPIIGSFDSAGLVGGTWMMINVGFGIYASRGTALQSTTWAPGVAGDWRASAAGGAPGGLSETTRAFFGAHLLYVGGTRTSPGVDGGPSSTYFTSECHVAPVDVSKNTLGTAVDCGEDLTRDRSRSALAVAGSHLYVVGGRSYEGAIGDVEMATLDDAAGTVSAFSAQPPLMSAGAAYKVSSASVTASGDHLFVAGGRTSSAAAPSATVLSAKINADGTLAAWQNVTDLPEALRDFAFVAFKGRLYVAGGVKADGTRSDVVYVTSVATNGSLGAWDSSNAKLPGARSDFVALAY